MGCDRAPPSSSTPGRSTSADPAVTPDVAGPSTGPSPDPAADKRERESTSAIWEIFKRVDRTTAECMLCPVKVDKAGKRIPKLINRHTGNSSSMWYHVAGAHKDRFEVMVKSGVVPHGVLKKVGRLPLDANATPIGRGLGGQMATFNKDYFHSCIWKHLIEKKEAYNTVDGYWLQKAFHHCHRSAKLHHRTTYARDITGNVDKFRMKLKETIQAADSRVSLTNDGWTSKANVPFIGVTAHWIKNWECRSAMLACTALRTNHTAAQLYEVLRKVVHTDFDLWENIHAITLDNHAVNTAMMNDHVLPNNPDLSPDGHIRCFAHSLNLGVGEICKPPPVAAVIDKARALVVHITGSALREQALRDIAAANPEGPKALKLQKDCPTRWNSSGDMLIQVIEQKSLILQYFANAPRDVQSFCPTFDEWALMKKLALILRPFKRITENVSGEKYPTLSVVVPLYNQIMDVLQKQMRKVEDAGSELQAAIEDKKKAWRTERDAARTAEGSRRRMTAAEREREREKDEREEARHEKQWVKEVFEGMAEERRYAAGLYRGMQAAVDKLSHYYSLTSDMYTLATVLDPRFRLKWYAQSSGEGHASTDAIREACLRLLRPYEAAFLREAADQQEAATAGASTSGSTVPETSAAPSDAATSSAAGSSAGGHGTEEENGGAGEEDDDEGAGHEGENTTLQLLPSSTGRSLEDDDDDMDIYDSMFVPETQAQTSTQGEGERQFDAYNRGERLPANSNILHFWAVNESQWPILARAARDVLAVPATSVPCERLFSVGRNIVRENRAQLNDVSVESVQQLASWIFVPELLDTY